MERHLLKLVEECDDTTQYQSDGMARRGNF